MLAVNRESVMRKTLKEMYAFIIKLIKIMYKHVLIMYINFIVKHNMEILIHENLLL